jgi:hypothetical protein
MIRIVLKTILLFLAVIMFLIAAGFGSALFHAFTEPYSSCSIRQYFPCSLQLEYFLFSLLMFLVLNPFLWFQPHLYLKYWFLILSGITCGIISLICFSEIVKFVSYQLNPASISQKKRRQKNRKKQYLIVSIIATILLVGMVSLQFKLTTNSNSAGYLPKQLGNVRVLASNVPTGLREGCDLHVFELEPDVSRKIKEIGMTYFEGVTKPRANSSLKERSPYSQWKYTPVPQDSSSWGTLNCNEETDTELINRIRSGMNRTGGYYTMTENKQGIILVLPNENLAAYL